MAVVEEAEVLRVKGGRALTLQEEGVEEEPELKSYLVLKHGGAVLATTSPRNPVVLVTLRRSRRLPGGRTPWPPLFWIEIERER
jgi:hypothetical protein